MKIAIIGASIAGSATALLFSKASASVSVFEQKAKIEIASKVCANIVTFSFLKLAKQFGISPAKVINKKFSIAKFYSQNNSIQLAVEDYEIDRKRLLEELTKKAQAYGAQFHFNTKFLDIEKTASGYSLIVQKGKRPAKLEGFDYIIGADGALSAVAKNAGLLQDRKFWLAIQTKVAKIKRKLNQGSYEIFFKEFGYYSYIFPSKRHIVVGIVANPEDAKEQFKQFIDFLGIKKCKVEAALIPLPKRIKFRKGNIFLAGDAACQTKFTGGGIVPALKTAFALKEIIINNKYKAAKDLSMEIFLHQLISNMLGKMSTTDFDKLFKISRKSDMGSRDELRKWIWKFVLRNPCMFRFLLRLF